jgi:transitional endoplasmic reticulum ATPase
MSERLASGDIYRADSRSGDGALSRQDLLRHSVQFCRVIGPDTVLVLQLRVVASLVGLDARRGLVRIAGPVLDALGARPYSIVKLTGQRTTAALVALSADTQDRSSVLVDDLVLTNLGVEAGSVVSVELVPSLAADRIVLRGPANVMQSLPPQTARLALLGKVISQGDSISLLQQDMAVPEGCSVDLLTQGRQQLQALFGTTWQGMVLTVDSAPAVPSVVTMGTAIEWAAAGPESSESAGDPATATVYPPSSSDSCDLPGAEHQSKELRELLETGLVNPAVLAKLGAKPSLGMLMTGPAGSGKTSIVRSVAGALGPTVREVWAPNIASLAPEKGNAYLAGLKAAATGTSGAREVLVVDDVEALAPREGDAPLAAAFLDLVREVVAAGRAVVAVSAVAPSIDPRLRAPDLLSREIILSLPDDTDRRALLAHLAEPLALATDVALDVIASHTPGFVAADLAALVNAAGQQAAVREQAAPSGDPRVNASDFTAALALVHPSSMDGQLVDPGTVGLNEIGGLAEVKEVLTESVLWPITYPGTFARLGVTPIRGVLLYGPPGCGKTYLVKALAHDGRANVLAVKGAELMSKWVGESEARVRQLFARARGAAPSLVFLDEVDALAPVRGSGQDEVGDRVVAALLTELDGIDQLRGVVVIAATNRPDMVDPALLRPGRLERSLFVPPPDAAARKEIFTATAAHTPLSDDVDIDALSVQTDGYSGADCAAVIRQAALAAMRRSMDAPCVTTEDIRSALTVVHPSLDPSQLTKLRAFAAAR